MTKISTTSAAVLASLLTAPVYADPAINKLISSTSMKGAIEIEAGFSKDYADISTSDLSLAVVELIFDSKVNEKISTHLLLGLDDATALEVDEATINIDMGNGLTLIAGQLYLPFGNHETNMISDTLPHVMSDSRETAVQADYKSGATTTSVYLFNGDVQETGASDAIDSAGLNIAYTTDDVTLGFSYTNNLTDADLITGKVGPTVSSYVSAASLYATASFGNKSVFFEYISAIDEFNAANLPISSSNTKPRAVNLEAGIEVDGSLFAVAAQATVDAVDFELPETRLSLSYSRKIMKSTSLAFELASDTDYSLADGGTGNKASSATLQLAVAF